MFPTSKIVNLFANSVTIWKTTVNTLHNFYTITFYFIYFSNLIKLLVEILILQFSGPQTISRYWQINQIFTAIFSNWVTNLVSLSGNHSSETRRIDILENCSITCHSWCLHLEHRYNSKTMIRIAHYQFTYTSECQRLTIKKN